MVKALIFINGWANHWLLLGVGHCRQFLVIALRLPTFIFFLFTYDIVITKPKKVFENILLNKSVCQFAVVGLERPISGVNV